MNNIRRFPDCLVLQMLLLAAVAAKQQSFVCQATNDKQMETNTLEKICESKRSNWIKIITHPVAFWVLDKPVLTSIAEACM